MRMEREAFKVPEAARTLSVSPRLLWRLIAAGEVGVIRLGRSVRVPRAEIDRILSEREGGRDDDR